MNMRERVYLFGSDGGLVGVSTEPSTLDADRPAVLLLNAGLLHHVGQNRLSVTLARALGELGWFTFRFDISGVGDSVTRKTAKPIQERSIDEIREAMDFLQQRRGINRFVLYGLCTGADNAFRAAVADERVCGAVLLEGYAYPTRRYYLNRYLPKLISSSFWQGKIARSLKTAGRAEDEGTYGDVSYHWILPSKEQVEKDLKTLISRDVSLMMVFAGSNSQYNYPTQFCESFPGLEFSDRLQVEYFAKGDHNFSLGSDRENLVNLIGAWIEQSIRY
ncbi:MAG: hypothetical protein OI74_16440 [Gammaproteobacteria bacterium (ex Lamellibrachia satsuma)]|nr:MAG: hypothetical protein HPY30_05300 [Gammaproteobacteria bacterium (ex Lamellibrachia satsuma)]RRS30638.1 MAG: hypothetical protein OI74_16440 [Gammaproteobacteria bacterium (ex Lamellibrachia satsuma)]